MKKYIDVMQWLDKKDAMTLFNGSNPAVIELEKVIWDKYFKHSDDKSGILWDILFMYIVEQRMRKIKNLVACGVVFDSENLFKVYMSPFGTDKEEEVTLFMQSNDIGDGLRVSMP